MTSLSGMLLLRTGYEFSDTYITTTSGVPQTYMTFDTPSLPVGNYMLFVQMVWRTSNASSLLDMTLLRDGVDMFPEHQVESSASTRSEVRKYVNGEGLFNVAVEGPVNFDLQFFREGATGYIHIFTGYVRWFRVS